MSHTSALGVEPTEAFGCCRRSAGEVLTLPADAGQGLCCKIHSWPRLAVDYALRMLAVVRRVLLVLEQHTVGLAPRIAGLAVH